MRERRDERGRALIEFVTHDSVRFTHHHPLSVSREKLDTPWGRITIQNAKFAGFTGLAPSAVCRLIARCLLDNAKPTRPLAPRRARVIDIAVSDTMSPRSRT